MAGSQASAPPSVASGAKSSSELFELIDRLQSARLDDQRCALPPTLQQSGDAPTVLDPVMAAKNQSKNLLKKVLQERKFTKCEV
jgi:hypothetical protein